MSFTPLRISTIRPTKTLTFDLFINFKEQYLCYANFGKTLKDSQILKLKKQKIARFYITAEHESKYQQYLDEILNETLNDDSLPVEEKASVVEGAASTAVERMKDNPQSISSFTMTTKAAGGIRKILRENPEALKIIFGKKVDKDDKIVKHSLNVAILATKIAEITKNRSDIVDDIATAALIHDLGLLQLPQESQYLFSKKVSDMDEDEKRLYNLHPEKAATMLVDKDYVNDNIINLILNHEEKLSGEGPNGITKLTKPEEILAMTDAFDKRITAYGMNPKDALKEFMMNELGNYSLDLMNVLKKVVKQVGIESLTL